MMGWNYNYLTGGGAYLSTFGFLMQVLMVVDLVLLMIWLWKNIQKK